VVVRNAFFNEWLRNNSPNVPRPANDTQQNNIFRRLPQGQKDACNAWVVAKVEAEQAAKRADGTARFASSHSSTLTEGNLQDQRSGASQEGFGGSAAIDLQTQDFWDGNLLLLHWDTAFMDSMEVWRKECPMVVRSKDIVQVWQVGSLRILGTFDKSREALVVRSSKTA
jgi:hypothetical protein